MFFFYYFQDFQGTTAKSMADVQKSIESGVIKIGTKYKVAPIAPLNKLYHHVGMVTNIKENGVEVFHLKKNLFSNSAERKCINFSAEKNDIFNFDRGVVFFYSKSLNENALKEMRCRTEEVLKKPFIPYGLRLNFAYNCESLIMYVITGEKIISPQVINFEKKFFFVGSLLILSFDCIMIVTNTIGFIKFYFKNEKELKK